MKGGKALNERRFSLRIHEASNDHQRLETTLTLEFKREAVELYRSSEKSIPKIAKLVLSPFVSQKMASFTVKPNKEDLQLLNQFIEEGTLTPVIDRTYPLAQLPEAIRYLEEGHAQGKVIITV